MGIQLKRSSTANKRPIPSLLSAGEPAINTNEASPALFFKDTNGNLVKVGPVHIGNSAPNSSPASTAATALIAGTTYQILTVGSTDFTSVGSSNNNVGTIFQATGAATGSGTVSGQQGVEKGEEWLDTSTTPSKLKIYDGSAWVEIGGNSSPFTTNDQSLSSSATVAASTNAGVFGPRYTIATGAILTISTGSFFTVLS